MQLHDDMNGIQVPTATNAPPRAMRRAPRLAAIAALVAVLGSGAVFGIAAAPAHAVPTGHMTAQAGPDNNTGGPWVP